ncbi:hypothetical protein C8R43DRAFT_860256, partial [Mycena crocata]
NHYSAYHTPDSVRMSYGDSMLLQPDLRVLEIFQWLVDGTGFTLPASVSNSDVPRQGPASGSCAIASFNFVETKLDPEVGKWTNSASPFFRNRGLRDLIIYH